jgi:hypothetical protein
MVGFLPLFPRARLRTSFFDRHYLAFSFDFLKNGRELVSAENT